jgi:hypothetical protein
MDSIDTTRTLGAGESQRQIGKFVKYVDLDLGTTISNAAATPIASPNPKREWLAIVNEDATNFIDLYTSGGAHFRIFPHGSAIFSRYGDMPMDGDLYALADTAPVIISCWERSRLT